MPTLDTPYGLTFGKQQAAAVVSLRRCVVTSRRIILCHAPSPRDAVSSAVANRRPDDTRSPAPSGTRMGAGETHTRLRTQVALRDIALPRSQLLID